MHVAQDPCSEFLGEGWAFTGGAAPRLWAGGAGAGGALAGDALLRLDFHLVGGLPFEEAQQLPRDDGGPQARPRRRGFSWATPPPWPCAGA